MSEALRPNPRNADATTPADPATDPAASSGRHLATIERIVSLHPIAGADSIVRARVRGWDVVVRLDEFEVGDLCVYFEVDTLLPSIDPRFATFAERGVRTDTAGNTGHVLRTAKLRGQYSQGLALPVYLFPELGNAAELNVGEDVTALVGVVKWDPPIPAELLGKVRGYRPGWIASTDEERIQNFAGILEAGFVRWVATEKIDGTSTTFWVDGSDHGVCTRNMDLLEDPNVGEWKAAHQLSIHARLRSEFGPVRAAVQGELFGLGSPMNPLKLTERRFAAFNLIVGGAVVPRAAWPQWLLDISVPVHDLTFPGSVEEALAQVETLKSLVAPGRAAEGIVWRAQDVSHVSLEDGSVHRASFKALSNRYLTKNGG